MLRVGFDGLAISAKGKGVSRAEYGALEALAATGQFELVAFLREPLAPPGVEAVLVEDRWSLEWELRGIPTAVRKHGLDAFVTVSERLPVRIEFPIVVWLFESPVHRIASHRARWGHFRERIANLATSVWWRRSLQRATHLAFGSRATSEEILAELDLDSTSVVYPGVPGGFSLADGQSRKRYVLHIGSNDPRDNTSSAVAACQRAGLRLLVVGGWSGDGAEALGRVSDEELRRLYREAGCLLDPTLYEGFGLGILEAMACGLPVVASAVTSIPEIAGDAAILCAPHDVESLARAVTRVFEEPGLSEEMSRRGIERAKSFTWEKTAEGLADAVERAVHRYRQRHRSHVS